MEVAPRPQCGTGTLQRCHVIASTSQKISPAPHLSLLRHSWGPAASQDVGGLASLQVSAMVLATGAYIGTHTGVLQRKQREKAKRPVRIRSTMLAERSVRFTVDRTMTQDLRGATVSWLDAAMRDDAATILLKGVERSEPVEGRSGCLHCYFPRVDVGPYSTQVRLTCMISIPSTGQADIQIVEVNPGVMDLKKRTVKFQENPRDILDASSAVELKWKPLSTGQGVTLMQRCVQQFKLKMPWWFPVPEVVVEAVLKPFVERSIVSSQRGVFRGIQDRLAAAPADAKP